MPLDISPRWWWPLPALALLASCAGPPRPGHQFASLVEAGRAAAASGQPLVLDAYADW